MVSVQGGPLAPVPVQKLPPARGHVRMPHSPALVQPSTTQSQVLPHEMLPHALVPVHVVRQRPELWLPHVMFWQALVPLHVMMQSPVPHVMLPHALSPTHMIVHLSAFVHVIEPHAPPVQLMLHVLPCGHVMLSPPLPFTVHVPSLPQPPLQTAGQAFWSITQYPLSHTRGDVQSLVWLQVS